MSSAEIKKGEEDSDFLKKKEKLEELHKKLIGRAISVIKPFDILNKINKESLKGKGMIKQSFDKYLEIFDLNWTECYVELSGHRFRHQITIAFFCPFLVESNQVIKSIDQLDCNNNSKDLACPGFIVIGGTKAKSIKAGFKNISSFNPDSSTFFKIPDRLGEIKANFKEIKPLFEQALRKAYSNSALKV